MSKQGKEVRKDIKESVILRFNNKEWNVCFIISLFSSSSSWIISLFCAISRFNSLDKKLEEHE